MAKYVGIRKYRERDSLFYYKVATEDFGGGQFYIEIDQQNKIMNIYRDYDCNLLVCSFDFKDLDRSVNYSDKEINEFLIPYVVIKVYKAIENNNFPQSLGYCA